MKTGKEALFKELKNIKLTEKKFIELDRKTEEFCRKLDKNVKRKKIKADIFIGGSLAKKTILKRQKYDIDIFVRFDKKYKDEKISDLLGKIVKGKRIHGSRDYFSVRKGKINFEIIPVIKISKPQDAGNVTDLSYFHVNYVKSKIKENRKLIEEILLAKAFCHAQKCYGAESYIKGFSGYSLELLIIYYKGFLNFVKAIVRSKKKIILDPEKHYKSKQEIMLNLNEAKLSSPIVFIDPTFKERNVVAGLSEETFNKFKEACKKFLVKPSWKFFHLKKIEGKKFNLILKVKTNKQAGDIAGSKLLKFFNLISEELKKNFSVQNKEFEYNEKQDAKLYFKIKKKKEIILQGPPVTALENVIKFRKKHKKVFVKNNMVYARELPLSVKKFLNKFRKNKKKFREMGVVGFGVAGLKKEILRN